MRDLFSEYIFFWKILMLRRTERDIIINIISYS